MRPPTSASAGLHHRDLTRSPNPRLQRTRSASPPSPLSRQPLGASLTRQYVIIIALVLVASSHVVAQDRRATEKAIATFEATHRGVEKTGGAVGAPRLVGQVNPDFPEAARKKKRQLSPIMVIAVVSELGDVVDPTIVMSAHPDLDPSILAAVRQWKYEPARKAGKSVKVFLIITVTLEPSRA
jgi:TonB family protein